MFKKYVRQKKLGDCAYFIFLAYLQLLFIFYFVKIDFWGNEAFATVE